MKTYKFICKKGYLKVTAKNILRAKELAMSKYGVVRFITIEKVTP